MINPLTLEKHRKNKSRHPAQTQNNTVHSSQVQDSSYLSQHKDTNPSVGVLPINKTDSH